MRSKACASTRRRRAAASSSASPNASSWRRPRARSNRADPTSLHPRANPSTRVDCSAWCPHSAARRRCGRRSRGSSWACSRCRGAGAPASADRLAADLLNHGRAPAAPPALAHGLRVAHTVPRRLRLIATALSVAAVVAVGAADWPTWAAATAVLALWMPAAVSELRWTHRHFPDLRYWHPVALGAALLVIVTLALVGLGEASAIVVAAALAIVAVAGLAIHNALDRVTDRWLAQTFPSADSARSGPPPRLGSGALSPRRDRSRRGRPGRSVLHRHLGRRRGDPGDKRRRDLPREATRAVGSSARSASPIGAAHGHGARVSELELLTLDQGRSPASSSGLRRSPRTSTRSPHSAAGGPRCEPMPCRSRRGRAWRGGSSSTRSSCSTTGWSRWCWRATSSSGVYGVCRGLVDIQRHRPAGRGPRAAGELRPGHHLPPAVRDQHARVARHPTADDMAAEAALDARQVLPLRWSPRQSARSPARSWYLVFVVSLLHDSERRRRQRVAWRTSSSGSRSSRSSPSWSSRPYPTSAHEATRSLRGDPPVLRLGCAPAGVDQHAAVRRGAGTALDELEASLLRGADVLAGPHQRRPSPVWPWLLLRRGADLRTSDRRRTR